MDRTFGSLLLVACSALAWAAFTPVLECFFDPQDFMTFLVPLENGSSLESYLADGWSWFEDGRRVGFFRPVTSLVYLAEFHLWGGNPQGYRLLTLLLHAACCLLVARLALGMGADTAGGIASALLFAVHPGAVAALGMITARGDVLSTLFTLGAVILAIRRRGGGAGLLLLLLILALGSKELGMAALVAVPLAFLARNPAGRFPPVAAAVAASACLFVIPRLILFGGMGGYSSLSALSAMPGNLASMLLKATGTWFAGPAGLKAAWIAAMLAVFAAGAASGGRRAASLALLFAMLVLLGFQSIIGTPDDHYAYAPSAISCAALGVAVPPRAPGRRGVVRAGSLVLLSLLIPSGILLSRRTAGAWAEVNRPMEAVFRAAEESAGLLEPGRTYYVPIPPGCGAVWQEMKNLPLYLAWLRPGEDFRFEFIADPAAGLPGRTLYMTPGGRLAIR